MVKIVICCGGGFSSSFMAKKVEKEIEELDLDKEYNVTFMPFGSFKKKFKEYDIAMLCPHLRHNANNWVKQENVDIPIYVLPPQIYGLMNAKIIIEDAQDVIDLYKKTKTNLVFFPGEEETLTNQRKVSYRQSKGEIR